MEIAGRLAVTLLERESERRALEESLGAATRGAGGLVLLEGPAGIGKTSLLDVAARRAGEMGLAVRRVVGDELVMDSSLAAVRELLWDGIEAAGADVWSGAARQAIPVFEADCGEPGDRWRADAVLQGLHALVANLARRAPLALLVDDAQWLDAASARFLIYLARRIEAVPVLLVVAIRSGEDAPPDRPSYRLSELAGAILRPARLSDAACTQIVRGVLGPRADDELCRSCHEAVSGNPFYLRELTAALAAEGARPTAELAARVRSAGVETVRRSVLVRLGRLGESAAALAEALTVLAAGAPLRLAAELAVIDHQDAAAAADRLRAADILAPGQTLAFAHPIVAEAVAAELPRSRRAALHRAAARLLLSEHVPADRVAAHLLSAEPYGEAWAVDALRAAARDGLASGAPEAAASYLRRAIAEPPPPELRFEVLRALGRAEALLPTAHDFAALREAISLAPDAHQRAETALELALALYGVLRNAEARALLVETLDRGPDLEPELAERLEQALIVGMLDDLSGRANALPRIKRHLERARRGEISDPRMLSALAAAALDTGWPAARAAALAQRALQDPRLLTEWLDDGFVTAAFVLCSTDELAEAAAAAARGIAEAERRGSAPMILQLTLVGSEAARLAGDLHAAQAWAERALTVARDVDAESHALVFLAASLAERGEHRRALRLVDRLELDDASSNAMIFRAMRGAVRVAAGELHAGLGELLEADRRLAATAQDLSVSVSWVPPAVDAMVGLGRRAEALELAEHELERAVAFGAARRHGVALATCGGVQSGAQGLSRLRDAVAILEGGPARVDYARALTALGARFASEGRRHEARATLGRALDLAHRLGAGAVAEQARSELLATGARPRRAALTGPEALTPAELRAALLAADGLTNREIAQRLYLSPKTVEAQLRYAYGKLAIRRRSELAAALGPVHHAKPLRETPASSKRLISL